MRQGSRDLAEDMDHKHKHRQGRGSYHIAGRDIRGEKSMPHACMLTPKSPSLTSTCFTGGAVLLLLLLSRPGAPPVPPPRTVLPMLESDEDRGVTGSTKTLAGLTADG